MVLLLRALQFADKRPVLSLQLSISPLRDMRAAEELMPTVPLVSAIKYGSRDMSFRRSQ